MRYPQESSLFPSTNTFLADKISFFQSEQDNKSLDAIKARAQSHHYAFLSAQRLPIEQELTHLQQVLRTQKKSIDPHLWLYAYYCSLMLSEYYKTGHYNSPEKHAEYLALAKTIEHYYATGKFPEKKFCTWQAQLQADLSDLLSTPFHLSKLRNWIGFINAYRIAFTFSRLTDQSLLQAIEPWGAFLRKNFHLFFDLEEINQKINGPTATFRALSVGLFLSRFLINLSLIIKHTLFPTQGEKANSVSTRFYQEIKKRYPQLANDLVWTTTNALTNYAAFFKISNPVATGLLMAGLSFDFALLAYRLNQSEKEHQAKIAEYTQEKELLQYQIKQAIQNHKCVTQLQNRLACVNAQIEEQHLKINVLRSNFYANLMAATLILFGVSLLLFATAPAAAASCYLLIVVSTALYICADLYSDYREKTLRAAQYSSKNQIEKVKQAKEEVSQAWEKFTTAMLKNTFMPVLIMGTLAFSWQAALVLLVLSITYEYTVKYQKIDAAYKANSLFSTPALESCKQQKALEPKHQLPTPKSA